MTDLHEGWGEVFELSILQMTLVLRDIRFLWGRK